VGSRREELAEYINNLDAPDMKSRRLAANSLERLRSQKAVAPLTKALYDHFGTVRVAAESALEEIGGSEAASALQAYRSQKPRLAEDERLSDDLGNLIHQSNFDPRSPAYVSTRNIGKR
jgi:hypothetical protein